MQYLRSKKWVDKNFSMPNILRKENFVESLYKQLEEFNNDKLEDEIALKLRTNGFLVKNENNNWILTDISKQLLNSNDEKILFLHINKTMVFFGEILFLLDQERLNIGTLLKIANEEYLIKNWKTKFPLSIRLQWLGDFGLTEYSDFENLYNITEKGQDYLKFINEDFEPLDIIEDNANEIESLIKNIPTWIFEVENNNINRIGYFAGENKYYLRTIKETIRMIKDGKNDISNITEITALSKLKKNSVKHFLKTLIDLDVIKRISLTAYEVTTIGEKILLLDEFQFVFYFDRIYTFVLEILPYLNENPQTNKELTAISKGKYSITKDGMRKRLIFLESANLIYKVDYYTYSITGVGKEVIIKYDLKKVINSDSEEIDTQLEEDTSISSLDSLLVELRQAASDSTNPSRFEKCVNDCFSQLGYYCEWLGNSGETDVLARTKTAPVSQYKIVIDAKSTSSPTISETAINFDTLKDHKKKHGADYIVVVGIKFGEGRLVRRAEEHKVALLDVDALSTILKNHSEVPLGYKEYEKLFCEGGIVNSNVLIEDRNNLVYQKELIYSVLDVLTEERSDGVTQGVLTSRDIYIFLKMNQNLSQSPTIAQIDEALEFLSSPFIRGIEKIKNSYSAKGSVNEISNILNFLSK